MKQAASSREKSAATALPRGAWRCSLVVVLLIALPTAVFALSSLRSTRTSAATHAAADNIFTSSPLIGPVGALITVSGTDLSYDDGTPVQIGYITYHPIMVPVCTPVTGGQSSPVHNHAFSGWFRWPTSTGTGTFQVCVLVNGSSTPIDANGYSVISASPPRVTVVPTIPSAGKKATVSGTNFLPGGSSVNLFWRSANGGSALALGTVTSDVMGAFTRTFTVPDRSSTGSYSVTASSGNEQPPALDASTAFRVNGITLAAVPTPTAQASPTPIVSPTVAAAPTATLQTSSTPVSQVQAITPQNNSGISSSSSLVLPLASGGLLLIIAALAAGILFVRHQRELAAAAASGAGGGPVAPDPLTMRIGAAYGLDSIAGKPTLKRPSLPNDAMARDPGPLPFDPGLAEAMRQAQVSIFATPRPPVKEEVLL